MVKALIQDASETQRAMPIDPFDFFIDVASKIGGLGGRTPSKDPYYVFHTSYFEAAPGPSRFIIQFHQLQARRGTLWLRVHMLPMEPGARAVLANSDRIQLNRLIQHGGRTEITFEGFRGMSFGLYAGIQDDTDATAEGVTILFDRPADVNEAAFAIADARNTTFGRNTSTPISHMLSSDLPSFATPVAQIATVGQLTEPSYRSIAEGLKVERTSATDWREFYVLRVLKRYGMALPGARGLGLGAKAELLATHLADSGLSIVAASPELAMNSMNSAAVNSGLTMRQADLFPLPADLVNFDFLWSIDALAFLSGSEEMLPFVEGALASLRPGGLAVHVCRYRLRDTAFSTPSLDRLAIERILLIMISRGHEVAQFRYNEENAIPLDDDGCGSVGFIIRKASSAL